MDDNIRYVSRFYRQMICEQRKRGSFIKNDSLMRYEVVEDNKGCSHELKFR